MSNVSSQKGISSLAVVIIIAVVVVAGVVAYVYLMPSPVAAPTKEYGNPAKSPSVATPTQYQEIPSPTPTSEGGNNQNPVVKPTPSQQAPALKTFNITVQNYSYSLKEIRVKKGDTVRINLTVTEGYHNWTIDEFNAQTASTSAPGNASVQFVADKAGTFEYYCSVDSHRAMGLVGKLIVE